MIRELGSMTANGHLVIGRESTDNEVSTLSIYAKDRIIQQRMKHQSETETRRRWQESFNGLMAYMIWLLPLIPCETD